MARRLVNTTIKNQKETFDFELWDMDSVASDLDHVVEFDVNGFDLSWRGNAKDSPIMGSVMSFSMFLTEAQRSAIMPVVFSDTEFRMCVRVMRGSTVFWAGVVHAENTTEEIGDGIITVSLQASDGLGMLKNIDWKQSDGTRYSGKMKVRDAVWACLKDLPYISLLGGTGSAVLMEHNLNRPVTENASFLFNHSSGGQYYGVMDYMKLNPNTFYYSNIEEKNIVGGKDFGSRDKYNPNDFTESHLVLKDIMSSMGATICLADGRFHVWDKTTQMATAHDYAYRRIEWYVTQNNELDTLGAAESGPMFVPTLYDRNALANAGTTTYRNYPRYDFLKGASLKAEHSVRGVTQQHAKAGTDLLYANGIGYHDSADRPVWETGEGFTSPLVNLFRVGRNDTPADPYGSIYDGSFEEGSTVTFDELFNTRNRDRHITEIQIPNGANEGSMRIHLSGNCNYTKKELNRTGPDIPSWGTLGIYKQRVEINDGSNWYRLSRPVRTIRYDSEGNDADISIDGSSANYSIKYWEKQYEWIIDTDSRYADAWLDVPLGANNAAVEDGGVSKFMQTDYPALAEGAGVYTPPLTKLAGDADNTLQTDDSRDVYVWRHDFIYDMPQASGTIEEIKIKEPVLEEWHSTNGPNLLYDSSGNTLDIGTSYLDPTYRTKSNATATDGFGPKPNGITRFQLSGVEVMFGDGTQEFDQNSVAFPTTTRGNEILNMDGTRLGASFVNTGGSTHGRFVASDFITVNTDEDNLKFAQAHDATVIKESLGELVTSNMLNMRGRVRQTINANSILAHESDADDVEQIIYPFSKLVTDTLDQTTKMIVPFEISYRLTEGAQRIQGWFLNASAEANVGSTTEAENNTSRGPLPSLGNFEKPSGSDLADFVQAEAVSNTGGGLTGGGKFGDLFPIFIKRY